MKYPLILLALFLAFFSLHSCSEDSDDSTATQSYSPMGTWQTTVIMPKDSVTIDTANVSITFTAVDSDTTFALAITNMAGAPIYVSNGTVSLSETSLTAIGTSCVLMGTPLSSEECGTPFLISTADLTATTWKIVGTSFATLPLDFLTDLQKSQLLTATLVFTRITE